VHSQGVCDLGQRPLLAETAISRSLADWTLDFDPATLLGLAQGA
jgi:hypothetical protein